MSLPSFTDDTKGCGPAIPLGMSLIQGVQEPLHSAEGFVCLVSFVHNWLAEEEGSWDLGIVFLCMCFAGLLIRKLFSQGPDLGGHIQNRLGPWEVPGVIDKVRWTHLLPGA